MTEYQPAQVRLYELRLLQGADPMKLITVMLESDIVKVDPLGQALQTQTGRRGFLQKAAGAVAANPVARAVAVQAGTQAVMQGAQAAVQHFTPKPKEIAPEFKGEVMLPHQAAASATNAYHKDHGSDLRYTPDDFDTDTHKEVTRAPRSGGDPEKSLDRLNPEGHPVNKHVFAYDPTPGRTDSPVWKSISHMGAWDHPKYTQLDKVASLSSKDKSNIVQADYMKHGSLLHAKVSNGTIAYENPFHPKFRDSLDTSIKAVHVNHSNGEITKFKVPLNFDDDDARNFEVREHGDQTDKWLRKNVTQHYNTRVASGVGDLAQHRKILKMRGFSSGLSGDEYTRHYQDKDWESKARLFEPGDKISYTHPTKTRKDIWGDHQAPNADVPVHVTDAHIHRVNPDGTMDVEDKSHSVLRKSETGGYWNQGGPEGPGYYREEHPIVTINQSHVLSGGSHSHVDFKDMSSPLKRTSAPNHLRHYLVVKQGDQGWTAHRRGPLWGDGPNSYHHTEPQHLASGKSAEELRDFLNSWEENHE